MDRPAKKKAKVTSVSKKTNNGEEKKKTKTFQKFKVSLNEEQKEAKLIILENPITALRGSAGSGKTFLGVQIALDLLIRGDIEKIVISRPTVAKDDLGFLPGDIKEKMDPWLAPIYSNLYTLWDKENIDQLIENAVIEILPFSFMRGRTITNACIIVDEAQNVTMEQMEMVLTRLGRGSKMIICGDSRQIDLKYRKDSGFDFLSILSEKVPGINVITLLQNHRHPILLDVLKIYEEFIGKPKSQSEQVEPQE